MTGYYTEPSFEAASPQPACGLQRAAVRAASRLGYAQALLDAPAAGQLAGGAGLAERARDRLPGRPAGCAGPADPGLGPAAPAGADGRAQTVRLAYAGNNEQPYASVGRWLIDQGELQADGVVAGHQGLGASQPEARARTAVEQPARWCSSAKSRCPTRCRPARRQGVPLTPGRSIAVDPKSVPYGTPVWLDTTEPLRTRRLRRLVLAQDTGSAIIGAVRADYFWGWGDERRGPSRTHEAAAALVGAVAEDGHELRAICDPSYGTPTAAPGCGCSQCLLSALPVESLACTADAGVAGSGSELVVRSRLPPRRLCRHSQRASATGRPRVARSVTLQLGYATDPGRRRVANGANRNPLNGVGHPLAASVCRGQALQRPLRDGSANSRNVPQTQVNSTTHAMALQWPTAGRRAVAGCAGAKQWPR